MKSFGTYEVMFKGKEISVDVEESHLWPYDETRLDNITAYLYDDNLEVFLKIDLDDNEEQIIYESIQEKLQNKDFDKLSGV